MGILKKALADNPDELLKYIPKSRTEDFWPGHDAIMVGQFIEPSSGVWPRRPEHTCKDSDAGWVITLRPFRSALNPIQERKYLVCAGCFYDRVKRHGHQVLEEAANCFDGLKGMWLKDKPAFKKWTNKVRQWRKRKGVTVAYRAYPQKDSSYFVIHDQQDEPGEPIPNDRTKLFNVIYDVARTPPGKSVSSSQGWGRGYQGNKGDGRVKHADKQTGEKEPCKQIWHTGSISKVAALIGFELDKKRDASLDIDPRELIQRIEDAKIRYYVTDDGLSLGEFFKEVEKVRGPYLKPLTGGLTADIVRYENYDPKLEKAIERAKGNGKQPAPITLTNSEGVYDVS